MTLIRGELLYNRYRIRDILGQGGMGNIYRALDESLGVEVAVKENLFTTEEYARQFRREALILASLRHPHLPRVTDHFVIEGQGQYLIMDYIKGEDLRDRMDRKGVITENEAIIIGINICDALAYMHSQKPPVLHRDIKPGNIRIASQGGIFLVDFGLAKIFIGSQSTTTGARAMTPGYSPPEQYGGARTDQRSDIYSLGATLYAAVTGVIPEDSLARAMEQTELTPVRKRNPKLSKIFARVLEKSLAVHPDDRFLSAEDFRAGLVNAAGKASPSLEVRETISPPPLKARDGVMRSPSDVDQGELEGSRREDRYPASTTGDWRSEAHSGISPERKSRWRFLIFVFILALLLIIAGGISMVYYPSINDRMVALLPPFIGVAQKDTITPTANQEGSPTDVQIVPPSVTNTTTPKPTISFTPNPSFTDSVSIHSSPTPSATIIPESTPTGTSTPTFTSVPTATPFGGGTGRIAFASNRTGLPQIWIINSDRTGLQQVTSMEGGACQPDWSPDRKRLVFISPCKDNREIYQNSSLFLINSDGTNLISLPTQNGGDYDPAWSPDGSQIVFTSLRNLGRPQLFVLNLEDNQVNHFLEEFNRGFQPSWSPDGSMILFVTTRNGPYQIWRATSDGSTQQRFSASGDMKDTYPVWSPNGRLIVFSQIERVGSVSRLMGTNYSASEYTEFPIYKESGLLPSREADFSPDGNWIVFEGWPETPNHDLYIMTISGGELTLLTQDPAFDFDPVW